MCENKQNSWKKTLWQDIKDNCAKYNSPSEVLGWLVISICLTVFASSLNLPKIICLTIGFLIFILAIPLNVNKPAVVMTATLVFIIWTSVLQVDNFKLAKKSYESAYRPYISILRLEIDKKTENEIIIKVPIKNTGNVPANNLKFTFSTLLGQNIKQEHISVPEKRAILFPESDLLVYKTRYTGNIDKFLKNPDLP